MGFTARSKRTAPKRILLSMWIKGSAAALFNHLQKAAKNSLRSSPWKWDGQYRHHFPCPQMTLAIFPYGFF